MNDFNKIESRIVNEMQTEVLEQMFDRDAGSVFDKIENNFLNIALSPQNYSNFINTPDRMTFIRSNLEFGDLFSGLFRVLKRTYLSASKIGLKDLQIILKLQEELPIQYNLELAIDHFCRETIYDIKKSYYRAYSDYLANAVKNNYSFAQYKETFLDDPAFKKSAQGKKFSSNRVYVPDHPKKRVVMDNMKAHVAKWFNDARNNILDKLGIVNEWVYTTRKDERVSTICAEDDGKTVESFKATKDGSVTGVIPQHVNCRCKWTFG